MAPKRTTKKKQYEALKHEYEEYKKHVMGKSPDPPELTKETRLLFMEWYQTERLNPHQHLKDIGFFKKGPTKKKRKTIRKESIKRHFLPQTNFQGFPKKDCVFQAKVNDYVYVPKNYKEADKDALFCKECMLSPCLVFGHYKELCDKASQLSIMEELPNNTVAKRCETLMKGFMRKHFGREYLNRVGLPSCVFEGIADVIPTMKPSKKEDSDSESSSDSSVCCDCGGALESDSEEESASGDESVCCDCGCVLDSDSEQENQFQL